MFLLKLNGILFILILLKLIFIQNTEGVDDNEKENEINKEMVEKEFKIYKKLPFEEEGSNSKKSKKGKNKKNKEEKVIEEKSPVEAKSLNPDASPFTLPQRQVTNNESNTQVNQGTSSSVPQTQNNSGNGMLMRRRRMRNHRNRIRQDTLTINSPIHHLQPPPLFFVHHPPIFSQNLLAQDISGTGVFRRDPSINQHNHSQRIYHQSNTIPIPAPAPLMPNHHQNPLAQNTSGTGVFLPNPELYSSINQHNHSQRIYHQSTTIPITAPAPLMSNHHTNPSFHNVHQLPSIYQPNYPQLRQHSGIRFNSRLNPYAKEYIPIKHRNIFNNPHFNPHQPETSTFHQNIGSNIWSNNGNVN
uniref:Uncharacterized protein n=1 Tax=Meloidogyne enterolobii TaxID=390850 RepID=A0A6V7UCY7_MELEN|nr:unnamed protein product [Meloidogyne enterolobii]